MPQDMNSRPGQEASANNCILPTILTTMKNLRVHFYVYQKLKTIFNQIVIDKISN